MVTEPTGVELTQEMEKPREKSVLRLFFSGLAMGAADVVPGVSGGTIAFIIGIYEDLIQAIHSIDLKFIRLFFSGQFRQAFASGSLRFLIPLLSGIAVAILTLSRVMVWALEHHPSLVWAFFFGLVLASVFVVAKRLKKWTPATVLVTGISAVAAYLLFGMVPVETPTAPWFLFLSGALAISAMILPGISGAFILLLLGKYHYLLDALVNFNLVPLIIAALGMVVGLLSFVRLLRWLLANYHDITVASLMGLVIGALRKVWPWKAIPENTAGLSEKDLLLLEVNVLPPELNSEVWMAVALMLVGFVVVLLLEYYGNRKTGRV